MALGRCSLTPPVHFHQVDGVSLTPSGQGRTTYTAAPGGSTEN